MIPSNKNTHKNNTEAVLWTLFLLLLGALLVWIYFVIPDFTRIPKTFSYTADIYSVDNLYDEANHRFSGPSISNTRFSYQVESVKNGILLIKNVFDVRKPTGEKIFAVERLYGIDPETGKHVPGYGDQNREGYLFGPVNTAGRDFTYWHINYNTPVHMKFMGVESILGLRVQKYSSDFQADQTKELSNIPQVGITRGINMDVHLDMWIEPETGQMVKYADRTNAYFYDLTTKIRQNPWNQFSNSFTFPSVAEHVAATQRQVFVLYIVKNVIPGAFLGLAILLFLFVLFRQYKVERMIKYIPLVVFLTGVFVSYMAYNGAVYLNYVQAERKFGTDTEKIISIITDRLSIYANGMRGARGLFDASNSVERGEFKIYVDTLDFSKNFPGLQAFGYSELVPAAQLPTHIQAMRKQGFPTYTVATSAGALKYAPIIFIEPFTGRNATALGYNTYADIGRRETIERAIDVGDIQLTRKLLISPDGGKTTIPAFSMYIPIYQKNVPLNSPDERRKAAVGVVFNAYRARDIFGTVLRDQILNFGVTIYDGAKVEPNNVLFDSTQYFGLAPIQKPEFTVVQTKTIFGRDWTYQFRSFPGYSIGGFAQVIPPTILLVGVLFSLIIAIYIHYLINSQQAAELLAKQTSGDIRKLQKAIENSSSHTIITDIDGHIIFANKAAQDITGYSLDEMIGQTPRLWKSGQMPPELYERLWHTIKVDKQSFKGEFINKRKNGELYTVVATVSPIIEDNVLTGFIGTEEDISGRAASENQLKEQKSNLERINKVMVERELKMIELKKELEEAKKKGVQS